MQYQKQKLERDLQVIQRQIMELTDIEGLHQQNFDTLTDKTYSLYDEKCQLEHGVSVRGHTPYESVVYQGSLS